MIVLRGYGGSLIITQGYGVEETARISRYKMSLMILPETYIETKIDEEVQISTKIEIETKIDGEVQTSTKIEIKIGEEVHISTKIVKGI